MPRTSAALLALLLLPATAFAQGGTEAEQEACTPDVFKLCSDFIPNEGPIVACLKAKHTQLSVACEQVMFPHAAMAPQDVQPPATHKRRKHRKSI